MPIPQNPVYVPPELLKLTLPPPQTGLPFNGQLHESDIKRGYVVPNPYPRPLPPELESEVSTNANLRSIKETYDEFIEVVRRATVRVVPPTDRLVLDRIHKTIEYVIKEGPVFEAIIIARENKNPTYSFLYDNQSQEHIYYRWKLYSILHGDNPFEWRTDEFRMFEGGSMWKPPPLNPYADGMPEELIEKSSILNDSLPENKLKKKTPFCEGTLNLRSTDSRMKGTLGTIKREVLGDILRNLDPTKVKIGSAMMFCINHSDAAKEIIDCIYESLQLLETPFQKKIARLFLVSDILNNCSAPVTNASYYRQGFRSKLVLIFEHLRTYLINIEDRYKADKFKQKALSVLGAWKEWTLYEDEFVINLSNILLGIKKAKEESHESKVLEEKVADDADKVIEEDLDGTELDDETLGKCLEAKGLSLRWYKTLDLSDDEDEDQEANKIEAIRTSEKSPSSARSSTHKSEENQEKIRFKASKWETVDPNDVADQVVTISKWETLVKEEDCDGSTDSSYENEKAKNSSPVVKKRFKSTSSSSSSSSSS